MDAFKDQRQSIDLHIFSMNEALTGAHAKAGLAQLINDEGKRDIICTRPYAVNFVQFHPGWSLENI